MQQGYIRLYRSLLNWEWFEDINVFRLFIFCLLKANHKTEKWQGITINKGSFVTSYEKLAISTGLTIQQVRTALNKLKSTGEITNKTTSQYSIITIKNWNLYQANDMQDNKQITNEQQTNNKQITTNNNEKNKEKENKKEKEILKNFNEFYFMYPVKKSKDKALSAYKKAILAAEPTAIMDGLKRYIDDIRIKRTEPRFIKHPSTWLNQGCWNDEYDSCIDYANPLFHNSRL